MTHIPHKVIKRRQTRRNVGGRPDKKMALFDNVIIILGVVNIIATLPQVIEIWVSQDASGVSLLSWGYYSFFACMLLIYGILHKDKPIIVNYTGGTILFSLVWLGAFIYQ